MYKIYQSKTYYAVPFQNRIFNKAIITSLTWQRLDVFATIAHSTASL
jgi:hypothetical protein